MQYYLMPKYATDLLEFINDKRHLSVEECAVLAE